MNDKDQPATAAGQGDQSEPPPQGDRLGRYRKHPPKQRCSAGYVGSARKGKRAVDTVANWQTPESPRQAPGPFVSADTAAEARERDDATVERRHNVSCAAAWDAKPKLD